MTDDIETETESNFTPESTNDVPPTPEEMEKSSDTDLSINDLATFKQIIEVSTERGAFKANELTQVGKLYEKLDIFLTNVVKQQSQQN